MASRFLFAVIFYVSIVNTLYGARILAVFPTATRSHHIVFQRVTKELVKRGHEVILLSPYPIFKKGKEPPKFQQIVVQKASMKVMNNVTKAASKAKVPADFNNVAMSAQRQLFEMHVNSRGMQTILKSNTSFDLILVEALYNLNFVFSHIYKAPMVALSSHGLTSYHYQYFGVPYHPILNANVLQRRIYNLTLWEKFANIVHEMKLYYLSWTHMKNDNAILKKLFGSGTPDVNELAKNLDLLLLNTWNIWNDNLQVPSNVIHLGGLHLRPPKELSGDLKEFLDKSTLGAIYFSIGTTLNKKTITMFCEVFAMLPYNVVWKFKNDTKCEHGRNVKISGWFPQSDLLWHPNVKLFITQGDLQSTDEAIYASVPVIGIPLKDDQWYNTEKYVKHKIGLQLDIRTVTENDMEDAIFEVIGNDTYKENIKRLNTIMHDEPQSSLDRAIWWIEYVIRHRGAKHLWPRSVDVTIFEFLMLDVVLVFLSCFVGTFLIGVIVIYLIFRQKIHRYFKNDNNSNKSRNGMILKKKTL